MRLFRRRREAMDLWLEATSAGRPAPATRRPARARDLDPSEVDPGERVGMDGRRLPRPKGAITGLESGGQTPAPYRDL